jgi:hypothetical protein
MRQAGVLSVLAKHPAAWPEKRLPPLDGRAGAGSATLCAAAPRTQQGVLNGAAKTIVSVSIGQ